MDDLDMFTALQLRNLREENLIKHKDNILKIQADIKDGLDDSFRHGFLEGYHIGKTDERFDVKGRIITNLIKDTRMTDEEIFEVVGLGEDKWIDYIKDLRGKYEEGKRVGIESLQDIED